MDALFASFSGDGVTLRAARPEDADTLARIFFEAFTDVYERNNVKATFSAIDPVLYFFNNILLVYDGVVGAVAEHNGAIVGSNFLWVEDTAGIGPITVSVAAQGKNIGRRMMQWSVAEAKRRGYETIRLTQDAFNAASFSLYLTTGFDSVDLFHRVRIPARGGAGVAVPADVSVRFASAEDVPACEAMCLRVNGYKRPGLIASVGDAVPAEKRLRVAVGKDGAIVGYSNGITTHTHSVALDEEGMKALILHECCRKVESGDTEDLQLHIFGRLNPGLLRWILTALSGARVHKNMTYMIYGPREDPRGVYFPNAIY